MNTAREHHRKKVIIIGGGFAGLSAAQNIDCSQFDVVLLDSNNYHLFQPLLYQVACGTLSASDIATPIRTILNRGAVTVLQHEVIGFDLDNQILETQAGQSLHYDILIVASGVTHSYFKHPEWEEFSPGLKTLDDAFAIRSKVLGALEIAERTEDPDVRDRCMRFVVIGAGPTGVELAGAIGELTRARLSRDFKRIDPSKAEIFLIEGSSQILPPYSLSHSNSAKKSLERLGVTVRENSTVTQVSKFSVTVSADGDEYQLQSATIIWTAGVQVTAIGRALAMRSKSETGPGGRIKVAADFSLPSYDNVFVIGDLAYFDHQEKPLPGVATAAQQAGKFVAGQLSKREVAPFNYVNQGQLAVIGRNAAVGMVGKQAVTGAIAWWLWLAIHIRGLIGFDVKIKVILTWAWKYLFGKNEARLITKSDIDCPDKSKNSDVA